MQTSNGFLSPLPLDDDLRSLDRHERVRPGDRSRPGADVVNGWGGPVGAHAAVGRQRFWTPLRVVMAFTVLFLAFGFLTKAPCLETSHPTDGSEPGLMWDGRQYYKACYADPIPLYGAEGLSQGALPYKYMWVEADGTVRYMEYPVISGMYQYVSAQAAQAWQAIAPGGPIEVVKYFVISSFVLALFWMVAVWATYKSAGRRPWDTLFVAASPLLVFQAFTNFDFIAIAFTALALLFWARRRPMWAGAMIGLGVAAKLYPLFLFGALLVVAIRRRRLLPVAKAAGVAVVTWLVVNLPIMIPFPQGWREFFRLNTDRPANPESIYAAVAGLTGWGGFDQGRPAGAAPETLNTVSLVLFLLCCAAVLAIGLTAPRTPRVAQLAFLIVALFLVTNKVWSPQYSLWLVPLAALAIPRATVLLPWMSFDALLWIAHMSYFHGVDKKGLNAEWFHSLVLVRDVLVLAVCAAVIWEIYRPARDLVRRTHEDAECGPDPLAGVLAGQPREPRTDDSEVRKPGKRPVTASPTTGARAGAGTAEGAVVRTGSSVVDPSGGTGAGRDAAT